MTPELLPEIYLHSAQFITSPSTLANCCLVSKEFHRIFVPYLYRYLNLRTGPPAPDRKSEFDPTSALRRLDTAYLGDRFVFTKCFEVAVRTNNDALMSSHLLSMPNIVSFTADCKNTEAPHVCSALKELPPRTFRDLELHVAVDMSLDSYGNYWWGGLTTREISPNRFKWPDFSNFQNLRSLKLFGLDGFMSKLAHDIAGVLIASPHLKVLGLGMHLNSFLKNYRLNQVEPETSKKLLIKDIIDEMYKLRPSNNPQLELEQLILGLGALPGKPLPVNETIDDLYPLTKLGSLKVLQLINGDTAGLESRKLLEIEPSAFHACTGLRRLIVDILSQDIIKLIKKLRSASKNLVELEIHRFSSTSREEILASPNILAPIGSHWKKIHLDIPLAIEYLFDRRTNQGPYTHLEELSLSLTIGPNSTIFGVLGPLPHGQWALLLSQFPTLPSLRRLLLYWDTPLPSYIASGLAYTLFSTHEENMHAQNLPSNFTSITFRSPDQDGNRSTRIFRRSFVFEGCEVGKEWKLVTGCSDEGGGWDWGVGLVGSKLAFFDGL